VAKRLADLERLSRVPCRGIWEIVAEIQIRQNTQAARQRLSVTDFAKLVSRSL